MNTRANKALLYPCVLVSFIIAAGQLYAVVPSQIVYTWLQYNVRTLLAHRRTKHVCVIDAKDEAKSRCPTDP